MKNTWFVKDCQNCEQLQTEMDRLMRSFKIYVKHVNKEIHDMSFEKMTSTINQCHQNIKSSTKWAEKAIQKGERE